MPFEMPSEVTDMLGGTSVHESTAPAGPDVSNTLRQEPSGLGTPTVPALFRPGADSPVAQQDKGSFAQTLFTTLAAGGDDIPTFQKMQLAGLKAKLEVSQEQRAWATFHHSTDVFNESVRQDNIRAAAKFAEVRPFLKAQIRAANDEERPGLVELNAKLAESMQPGAGDYIRHYGNSKDNMAALDGMDLVLSDPASQKLFQPLLDTQGYQNFSQDPRVLAKGKILSHDVLSFLSTKLPADVKVKLHKGDMSEDDLRSEFDKIMLDPKNQMSAQEISHAKIAMDSETGQSIMANMGAVLGKSSVAQQMHAKVGGSGSPLTKMRADYYAQIKTQLDNADKNGLSEQDKNELEREYKTGMNLIAKESSPAQSPGSVAGLTIADLSKGLAQPYQTTAEMLQRTKPGTPERAQGQAWAHQALEAQKTYGAQAQLQKQMQTPVDMSKVDMYSRKDILSGNPRKLSVPMNEIDKRTNPDMFEGDPKVMQAITKLSIAKAQGDNEMFATAARAFTGTTTFGLTTQWTKWQALELGGLAAAAVSADPANDALVLYHDTYTAWAGKDARALGDEVGTMTDADRAVWKDTFPKPTDTPSIQKLKRDMFDRMIQVIYDINARIAVGETPSKALRDKKEGIFGEAADTLAKIKAKTSPQKSAGSTGRDKLEKMMMQESIK